MTRQKAIQMLLHKVKLELLMKITAIRSEEQPFNFALQLLNASLSTSDPCDNKKNWFTALGVLCIYQRTFAGRLLQDARETGGDPPMKPIDKKELIDAIASGSKLTKADAGRGLN